VAASTQKLRNIGPKSAAWLRQVGLRSLGEIAAIGTVEAFMKVRRAGFKPSLNLLYALEGAILDCHWQEIPDERRTQLVAGAEAAIALLPAPRGRPAAAPVTMTIIDDRSMPGMVKFPDQHFAMTESHGQEIHSDPISP
jgi:DNA transformation protein